MRALARIIGLVALALGGQPAVAEGLEVQPVIGGNPMRCYDYRGAVVRTLKTTELGDVGRASIIARMPIISLDADRLGALPEKMQVFFYMHECAHHVLGHVIRPTLESEREADCWSITLGRTVTPAEVVLCMIDLKLVRLAHDPGHRDSLVDVIGYASLLQEVQP